MPRWEDNIKMYLREIRREGVNWILLAQNKGVGGPLMNTVMNLRVPQRAENFLTS
jgi:hypothetical protein